MKVHKVIGLAAAVCAAIVPLWALNVKQAAARDNGKYILHVGGSCSSAWMNDEELRYASRTGWESTDAKIDNTESISASRDQLRTVLDQYCAKSKNQSCYIVSHSGGVALVNYTLDTSADNWNIVEVGATGGGDGGTEAWRFGIFAGLKNGVWDCTFTQDLEPSYIRNLYNHNDTDGIAFQRYAGYDGAAYSSWLILGEDDSVVPYHSAGGCVSASRYTSCGCTKFTNHYWKACQDKNHDGIKMSYINAKGW